MSDVPFPTLKALPADAKPRERLLRRGGKALTDAEVLSIVLGSGGPGRTALELAREVLADCGGMLGLAGADRAALEGRGLGPAKAGALLAALELARRLARARVPQRQLMERPDILANYLALSYGKLDQEVMGAVFLDSRNRLIADVELYRGTMTRTAVEPRAVLKEALRHHASAFVMFHTHPSGDPAPSADDLAFTRQLADAGEILGIRMIDHLILGNAGRWVSLQRRGAW